MWFWTLVSLFQLDLFQNIVWIPKQLFATIVCFNYINKIDNPIQKLKFKTSINEKHFTKQWNFWTIKKSFHHVIITVCWIIMRWKFLFFYSHRMQTRKYFFAQQSYILWLKMAVIKICLICCRTQTTQKKYVPKVVYCENGLLPLPSSCCVNESVGE